MSAERTTAHAFWDFSFAFYARPGVARACLELQESCGVDVNVLLFLLYLARSRRLLVAADVERIDALATPWRQAIVIPLRNVRRALKAPVGAFHPDATAALRTEVKRIELAAERVQQETLERLAVDEALGTPCLDPAACARVHLQLYGDRIGALEGDPSERILAQFAALVSQ
ncbi:MAG: TIGR02444 family protein [Burkholderiales bacterium]